MNRFKNVRIASLLGIFSNLFLFIIKIIIGLFTKSQAMIADAFNSGGDILASFMTFIGNKIASKPKDDDHNLGHGKAEYIYSMLISVVMLLAAFLMIKESFLSIFEHKEYIFSFWLIVVCIVTIVIKFCLYVYTRKISMFHNNLLVEANSKDHLNDGILTIFTLFSSILAYYNIYFLDGIVGILISLWIIISALKIFMSSYDVLMDKSIDNETKNEVYKIIENHKEVIKINHFNSTPVGYQYQISFTIFVDGNLSTFKSHEIADKLEKEINSKISDIYLTVIHVNPMEIQK